MLLLLLFRKQKALIMNEKVYPQIKTFMPRQRRLTGSRLNAFDQLWGTYGLVALSGAIDFSKTFGRNAPTVLEIGFGTGETLHEMAKNHPEWNFIGIEVYRPGVAALLAKLKIEPIDNIRIFAEDANTVIQKCIPDNSLEKILIFFPDPWPKRRHFKRRIINENFIKLIQHKLKAQGILHIATDWEDYATHTLAVMQNQPGFVNLADNNQFVLRPSYRPLTKFEQRGIRHGHQIFDLMFQKISD